MFEGKDIMKRTQSELPSNRCSWIRKEFLPNSQEYLELKAACLRGDYQTHFVEHNFQNFNNAENIFLYKLISDNYEDIPAYQIIKDDFNLFKHKECVVLFDETEGNMPMEVEKIMNSFPTDMTLRWGVKRKREIKILFC